MRKNGFIRILVFSLFLVMFLSHRGYAEPLLTGNASSTPANYNTSSISEFNVTWTNSTENENVTSCNFTLGRPDGTITTYDSILPNSTIPPSLCSINFTQNELGSAGDYNYTWSAKSDSYYWNTIDLWNFTIEKADPISNMHVEINGNSTFPHIPVSLMYPIQSNITVWENNTGDDGCTYKLYRNVSGIYTDVTTTENRNYFGIDRSVNIVETNSTSVSITYISTLVYDTVSGVVLEVYMEKTDSTDTAIVSYDVIETNIFTGEVIPDLPLSMFAVLIIISLSAEAIFLRKKLLKSKN